MPGPGQITNRLCGVAGTIFTMGGVAPPRGPSEGGGINTVLAQQAFASLNKATVEAPEAVKNGISPEFN